MSNEKIIKALSDKGLVVHPIPYSDYSNGFYASTNSIDCRVVSPHKGTDNRYMIGFTTYSGFDSWDNSTAIERFFDTEDEVVAYIKDHWTDILVKLLDYLSDLYDELDETYNREQDEMFAEYGL